MGASASRVQYQVDKAAAVTLRSSADAAETATATETAVSINELNKAYWHNFEIPHGKMVVVFNVKALDGSGDATYDLSLQVDDVLAQNNSPVVVGGPLRIAAVGVYEMVVDSKGIPALDTDHDGGDKFMAAKVTIGGSTGKSISYDCWIAKSLRA